MSNTIRLLAIATAFSGYLPPQDRDSAFIDSGRYIDGQVSPVPNYGTSDCGAAAYRRSIAVLKEFLAGEPPIETRWSKNGSKNATIDPLFCKADSTK